MSVVKEGKLKVYQDRAWSQVSGRLLSDAVFEYADKKIEIGPFVSVTPSTKRANFTGVFVINTKEETDHDSGPMLAAEGEEGNKWMRLINYVRLQNNIKATHDHPLTQMSAIPPKKNTAGPSIITLTAKEEEVNNCTICKKTVNPTEGYCCEFCNNNTLNQNKYYQCSDCYKGFKEFETPLIDSPNHSHQLMKIPQKHDRQWGYAGQTFDCSKCSKKIKADNGYHCIECEEWTECEQRVNVAKISANAQNTAEIDAKMQLKLDLLTSIMKVDGNKYTYNNVKTAGCPQAASVIANKHWDLSQLNERPADKAYFEVTVNKMNKDGYVSVGIGNQIFQQNQLLGYQQNSFGYLNDGRAFQNIGANEANFECFTAGDTVGCGVLLDSYNQRYVFYTKNGQIVGVFKGTLHRGMDCFPGISFTRSAAPEFVVNFEAPFKLDLSTIPDYRSDRQNRIEALPTETLSMCLSIAVKSPMESTQLTSISKRCREAAHSNEVWKKLFLQKWPLQNSQLKIKSWYHLYKRRNQAENPRVAARAFSIKSHSSTKHFIENCDIEFECPLVYEKLAQKESGSRFCDKCQKTVYEVSDEDQLRQFSEMGRCVTFIKKVKKDELDRVPIRRMMGARPVSPPQVPPKIPPPFQK